MRYSTVGIILFWRCINPSRKLGAEEEDAPIPDVIKNVAPKGDSLLSVIYIVFFAHLYTITALENEIRGREMRKILKA